MRRGARMKRREFITVLGGALTWASIAHAAPNAAIRVACHEDAKRLCVNAFGNPEAVRTCMREHHQQLSDKCKATIAEVKRGGNSAQGKNPQLRASRRERCIAYVQLQAKARRKTSTRALHAWRADTGQFQ